MNNNQHNFDTEPNLPFDENGKKAFGLPSNYFEKFEKNLIKKIELETELTEFPLLASIKKEPVFKTPEHYFSALENSSEYAAELANFAALQAIPKTSVVPLNEEYVAYFKTSLSHKIELADELKLYTTLYAVDKINLFTVTDNYFENLHSHIKEKIHSNATNNAPVMQMIWDFVFGKKLAFAFGISLIVCVSVFTFKQRNTNTITEDCKTLACLQKRDIVKTNAIAAFDDDQLMDLVDVNALDKQLKSTTIALDTLQQEEFILDNVSANQLIDEL